VARARILATYVLQIAPRSKYSNLIIIQLKSLFDVLADSWENILPEVVGVNRVLRSARQQLRVARIRESELVCDLGNGAYL
jgi:predicted TPR repeat methyltransferase